MGGIRDNSLPDQPVCLYSLGMLCTNKLGAGTVLASQLGSGCATQCEATPYASYVRPTWPSATFDCQLQAWMIRQLVTGIRIRIGGSLESTNNHKLLLALTCLCGSLHSLRTRPHGWTQLSSKKPVWRVLSASRHQRCIGNFVVSGCREFGVCSAVCAISLCHLDNLGAVLCALEHEHGGPPLRLALIWI